MSSRKLVVIIGGTGTQVLFFICSTVFAHPHLQGGSVLAELSKHASEYALRVVTRDTTKPSAQGLLATYPGVELFQADLDDASSLTSAFTGAFAIYAYTNFFDVPFLDEEAWSRNEIRERAQGMNLLNAAKATKGLQHYIWSSTPDAAAQSNGKHTKVAFFQSKSQVSAALQHEAELWGKTTELWIGFMYENYKKFQPFFGPNPLPVSHIASCAHVLY